MAGTARTPKSAAPCVSPPRAKAIAITPPLTDIEGTHKAFQLGDVDVLSDDGHIASLGFAGAAQFLTLTSVATPEAPIVNAGILNQLRMVADPADGYQVTSLRARGTRPPYTACIVPMGN